MQQYILEQTQIDELLQGLHEAYSRCKGVQQQYVANLEAQHMESPEMAMEVVEDLENFGHMLSLLSKQWEELRGLQSMVAEHYLHDMISSLEDPTELAPVADEGVEGYDVGVALGIDFVIADQEKDAAKAVKTAKAKPASSSFMDLFSNVSETNLSDTLEVVTPKDTKKKHKKRCKDCTGDSLIPEEREKCCIVKQEKKKKKSKNKSKHKEEAPSVDKWVKKLSKWERYAEEHGDAWTEKVLQKVAKKIEKKTEKRGMKAVFKKHKLDRFAKLTRED